MNRNILCLCLCLVLCGSGAALAEVSFTEEDFPYIDGSTATVPLHRAIRAHFLGEAAAGEVIHSRTAEAYDELLYGDVNLILVTYPSRWDMAYFDEEGDATITEAFLNSRFDSLLEMTPVCGTRWCS